MSLKAQIEAILFLSQKPLTATEISQQANLDLNEVRQHLSQLIQEYELRDTGLMIDASNGYFLRVKEEYENLTEELLPLEIKTGCLRTLSVIALKEPIYQTELTKIRGGGVYEHIKDLVKLGLVHKRKEGTRNVVKTTPLFAQYFKFSVDGLELQDILKDKKKHVKFARRADILAMQQAEEEARKAEEETKQEEQTDEQSEANENIINTETETQAEQPSEKQVSTEIQTIEPATEQKPEAQNEQQSSIEATKEDAETATESPVEQLKETEVNTEIAEIQEEQASKQAPETIIPETAAKESSHAETANEAPEAESQSEPKTETIETFLNELDNSALNF